MTEIRQPSALELGLARAVADPARALAFLDALRAERSLLGFIRMLWPVLEPGREFISGWPVEAICDHLEAVSRGEIRRLLINVPPGCMKSLTTNVFWPAWEWGPRNRPDLRYMCASYAESLTIRDNRRCRALVLSEPYRAAWGSRFAMSTEQAAKVRFDNNKTGFKLATSVGGVGTGERGDRFIIDDPHSVLEAESEVKREQVLTWFTEVVPTRINDPDRSAIIVIMQRVHESDVSGLIIAKELGYTHLCLPMEHEEDRACRTPFFTDPRTEPGQLMWPERFSRDYLEKDLKPFLSARGGSYAIAGQLQQRPAPRGGGMFQRKDFRMVEQPAPPQAPRVRGWDLAASRDGHAAYTVGVKMALWDKRVVIEDVRRIRGSPHEVRQLIRQTTEADGRMVVQSIPQDPGQAGIAQREDLAGLLAGFNFHFSPETGSKEDRARPLAAQCEAGMIDAVRAPWNDVFIAEACSFPAGEFKDQVDAATRAYSHLIQRRDGPSAFIAPRVF
jgi:predicted phage terminase large subunit-like protein